MYVCITKWINEWFSMELVLTVLIYPVSQFLSRRLISASLCCSLLSTVRWSAVANVWNSAQCWSSMTYSPSAGLGHGLLSTAHGLDAWHTHTHTHTHTTGYSHSSANDSVWMKSQCRFTSRYCTLTFEPKMFAVHTTHLSNAFSS